MTSNNTHILKMVDFFFHTHDNEQMTTWTVLNTNDLHPPPPTNKYTNISKLILHPVERKSLTNKSIILVFFKTNTHTRTHTHCDTCPFFQMWEKLNAREKQKSFDVIYVVHVTCYGVNVMADWCILIRYSECIFSSFLLNAFKWFCRRFYLFLFCFRCTFSFSHICNMDFCTKCVCVFLTSL